MAGNRLPWSIGMPFNLTAGVLGGYERRTAQI